MAASTSSTMTENRSMALLYRDEYQEPIVLSGTVAEGRSHQQQLCLKAMVSADRCELRLFLLSYEHGDR
jgi:hypothetical protein